MNKLGLLRNGAVFLVILLCLWQKSTKVEAAFALPVTQKPAVQADESTRSIPVKASSGEKALSEKAVNGTKISPPPDDFDLFDPFMGFPFFPFPFPDLKRDVFRLNLTKGKGEGLSTRGAPMKPKPFFFVDFTFKIPAAGNASLGLTKKDAPLRLGGSNAPGGEEEWKGQKEKAPQQRKDMKVDILYDDWSFFDDSPMFHPDLDEFLPKSDFLFFDFPLLSKQSKKFARQKRDEVKPAVKSDINFIMDIIDEAISRTKKEMERTAPLWDLMSNPGKVILSEEKREKGLSDDPLEKIVPRADDRRMLPSKFWNDKKYGKGSVKPTAFDATQPKNPVIMSKVVKIGKIHFGGEDYPKGKKKRRNSSALEKKGSHGLQETSIEVIQMDETGKPHSKQIDDFFSPVRSSPKFRNRARGPAPEKGLKIGPEDSKLIAAMMSRDGQDKAGTLNAGRVEDPESYRVRRSKGNGFKMAANGKRETKENGGRGFEAIHSQTSFGRQKRVDAEETTETKDEARKNITNVLGEFFSMIKKLKDPKTYFPAKNARESGETEDFNWPELSESHKVGSFLKSPGKRLRRDEIDGTEEPLESNELDPFSSGRELPTEQVADLNYLFLTVTLPTMLAFTLLLVICFFNLQVRGWLCTKLFKPRHVYVVEESVPKSKQMTPQETKPAKAETLVTES